MDELVRQMAELKSELAQLREELSISEERNEERDLLIIQMQRKSAVNKQTADSAMYGLLILVGLVLAIMVGLRLEGDWGSFDGKTVIELLSVPAIASAVAVIVRMLVEQRRLPPPPTR